jgi:hypothetical protein
LTDDRVAMVKTLTERVIDYRFVFMHEALRFTEARLHTPDPPSDA